MKKEWMPKEPRAPKSQEMEGKEDAEHQATEAPASRGGLAGLHRHLGNQAVQRLLAQRSGQGAFEVSDGTSERIDRERGGGQPLEGALQAQMSQSIGHDLSGVRVHTSPQADELNHQLAAQAFTTGQDVFFRQGAYDPHSTDGQELIAHELTHVAQQGSGAVNAGGRMTVGAPDDAHEQEADAVAKQAISPANQAGSGAAASGAQRQEEEEGEEIAQPKLIQPQIEEEEEMAQPKLIQPQVEEEEEEEEMMQPKLIQPQIEEEEEMAQPKLIQPQVEEEEESAMA